jgi:hypothetical protein
MPRLCRFHDLHNGRAVFVNPATVRYVTAAHGNGNSGAVIHFDNDHKIEVAGTVDQAVRALDDAYT